MSQALPFGTTGSGSTTDRPGLDQLSLLPASCDYHCFRRADGRPREGQASRQPWVVPGRGAESDSGRHRRACDPVPRALPEPGPGVVLSAHLSQVSPCVPSRPDPWTLLFSGRRPADSTARGRTADSGPCTGVGIDSLGDLARAGVEATHRPRLTGGRGASALESVSDLPTVVQQTSVPCGPPAAIAQVLGQAWVRRALGSSDAGPGRCGRRGDGQAFLLPF